jgi:hypothetical protein
MIGISAAILVSSAAYAEPLKLTEKQMDQVTAGVGFMQASEKHLSDGNGEDTRSAWGALGPRFDPVINTNSAVTVFVPEKE